MMSVDNSIQGDSHNLGIETNYILEPGEIISEDETDNKSSCQDVQQIKRRSNRETRKRRISHPSHTDTHTKRQRKQSPIRNAKHHQRENKSLEKLVKKDVNIHGRDKSKTTSMRNRSKVDSTPSRHERRDTRVQHNHRNPQYNDDEEERQDYCRRPNNLHRLSRYNRGRKIDFQRKSGYNRRKMGRNIREPEKRISGPDSISAKSSNSGCFSQRGNGDGRFRSNREQSFDSHRDKIDNVDNTSFQRETYNDRHSYLGDSNERCYSNGPMNNGSYSPMINHYESNDQRGNRSGISLYDSCNRHSPRREDSGIFDGIYSHGKEYIDNDNYRWDNIRGVPSASANTCTDTNIQNRLRYDENRTSQRQFDIASPESKNSCPPYKYMRQSMFQYQAHRSNKADSQKRVRGRDGSYRNVKLDGLKASEVKIDFDKMLVMDSNELAAYLCVHNRDLDTFLWKDKKMNDILPFLKIIGCLVKSSSTSLVEKALCPFKQRKFFERADVKDTICAVRCCSNETLDEKQTEILMHLLSLMKALVFLLKVERSELMPILDSLELSANEKINGEKQRDAMLLIRSIRERWNSPKIKETENKLSGLSILPSLFEIDTFVKSVKEIGYDNEETYLRRLFLVHREDFLRPLCKGMLSLKEDLKNHPNCLYTNWRHDDIRVYRNVEFIIRCCNEQSGITWRIRFDVTQYSRINWASRKLLQHGSLVCLTNTKFTFLQYATVAERNPDDLKWGILEIKFAEDSISNEVFQQPDMILIESQAFFPAYFHTLESLKNMHSTVFNNEECLPFGNQLVYLSKNNEIPNYLKSVTDHSFDFDCFDSELGKIDILNHSVRPDEEFLGMDKSQYNAFFASLTNKVALIQGPPGTGKTVVGLKLAELLLRNEQIWRQTNDECTSGPLLLLSYTNHALDQFLLEISKRLSDSNVKDIVRIGRRSDVQELAKYNLSAHRKRCEESRSYIFDHVTGEIKERTIQECGNELKQMAVTAKQQLHVRINEHKNLKKLREELTDGIVHQDWLYSIAGVLSKKHFRELQHVKRKDAFIWWLNLDKIVGIYPQTRFEDQENSYEEDDFGYCDPCDEYDEYYDDASDEDENLTEKMLSLKVDFEKLIMTLSFNMINSNSKPDNGKVFWQNYSIEEKSFLMQTIQKQIRLTEAMTFDEAIHISNIWELNDNDKWRLYKFWLEEALVPIDKEIKECEESYARAQLRYTETQQVADVHILANAKLVACTTSRAARDIENLKRVSPSIIILEEAAEIPEHHVVSCLTSSCEHLIMIGDHQQLRPSYNDYKTALKHKINISLFERLIRGRFPFSCLQFQHRMRPEISKLLVPYIYEDLRDDVSVLSYKCIKGISKDLFFLTHTVNEDNDMEEASRSHKNTHEAEVIQNLYRYLRLQGYSSSQITILSPYLDQTRLLRQMIKPVDDELNEHIQKEHTFGNIHSMEANLKETDERENLGVRITSVDNFQGEENDIILLSLVRSNTTNKIGYLSEANRICVALSRAKMGLYAVGNFKLLISNSPLWKKIVQDAESRNCFGTRLELKCQNHNVSTFVSTPNDFNNVPDGGCQRNCKIKKQCGHFCSRKCHIDDTLHDEKCLKYCTKTCVNGHICMDICHYPNRCNKCQENIEKVIQKCKHKQMMKCHQNPEEVACKTRCEEILSCGHRCQKRCSEPCNTDENCNELIKAKARCGHEVQVACHTKNDPPCTVPCKETLKCGHSCIGNCSECSQGRLHAPCRHKCDRNLVCGHICKDSCNYDCQPCTNICERKCQHNDKCKNKCGEPCVQCNEPCKWRCRRPCKKSLSCSKTCSELCDRPKCNEPCIYRRRCGHICPGLLCEPKCLDYCRICDSKKLQDIFFGNEDEKDALFIQLDDCRCVFEVTGLDTYIQTQMENKEDGIKSLKCPKCSKKITYSSRYRNELKIINRNVEGVFRTLHQINDGYNINARRHRIEINILTTRLYIKSSEIENLLKAVKRSKSIHQLNVIEDKMSYYEETSKLKTSLYDLGKTCNPVLKAWLSRLNTWISIKRDRFSDQNHQECQLELRRLKLIFDIYFFKQKLNNETDKLLEFPNSIGEMLLKLETSEKIAENEISSMRKLFQETASEMVGLSFKEKKMIKRAMENEFRGSGHWYQCSNGHYYSIGECGMPMEQRKCPHCNVTIGGTDHILSQENDRAMDMENL